MYIDDPRAEATRVMNLVKDSLLLPDGALGLEREGDVLRPYHIFPDLGDVLPFFDYFGEKSFVDSQVRLYAQSLRRGYLVSQFPALGLKGLVKSYEYTDLLLGLIWYAKDRRSEEALALLHQAIIVARSAFRVGKKLRSFYHISGFRIPVIDTRDSMFIESWVALFKETGDHRYLAEALELFDVLTATSFYQRYGLFADYEPANVLGRLLLWRSNKRMQSSICKHTSSALFAFVELYRATGEPRVLAALRRVIDSIGTRAIEGGVLERFDPSSRSHRVSLTASFSILDGICDSAKFIPALHDESIRLARGIADFWLERQGATGLFPLYEGGKETFIDSETDMIVALHKLHEVTGDGRYAAAAERATDGLLKYHGGAQYCLAVHVDSGEVLNAAQRTKFVCLSLKVLILLLEYARGNTIYGSPELFELLKDR